MRVLLCSTADTDLLAARDCGADYILANPARLSEREVVPLAADCDVVVVRLLGGRRAWQEGLDALLATGKPVLALGGEATPDPELMALSTVPSRVVAQALAYLVEGGGANLRQLADFLSDSVLLTGIGFDPPERTPIYGTHGDRAHDPAKPTVGIVFYRAHELAGNTAFADSLADAVEAKGANAVPVFCGSLRGLGAADAAGLRELLGRCDAIIATVLAAGGAVAADASAGGDEDAWDAGALAALDVPVLQGLVLTGSRAAWVTSGAALTPMDAGMQVAIPEFDGRLIGVPFSFKEAGADGIPVYVADPERCARVAGMAAKLAVLRHKPTAAKRLAVVLSSYPTKHSRVGNAVGLDTPASAVVLLKRLHAQGWDLGGLDVDALDGDTLIHRLIAAGGHDVDWLTEDQMAQAAITVPAGGYRSYFDALPASLRSAMIEHWGEAPGTLYVNGGEIYVAALRFGNVVLMIQPPRGFGENPIAIYHDPDLPPSHQYMAAYRYLERDFGADAVLHLGKHGTMEWLPGKGVGLAADCAPDAVLGDLPLIYPFIVNDPGEGSQAKRRGHAVIVDHLIPPMARADTYGDMAKLEQLLDEYATVAALDPAKLPTLRTQVWELVTRAELHRDMHQEEIPDAEDFDEFVMHIDGYLCEVKDVQIRDGLHILGRAPEGAELVNDVLAVLRARQVFGGQVGALPGLRTALAAHFGLDEQALLAQPGAAAGDIGSLGAHVAGPASSGADVIDLLETLARRLVEAVATRGWQAKLVQQVVCEELGEPLPEVTEVLAFGCTELAPRLARTTDEIDHVLHALAGGFVPPGPSGSPTRGLVSVLPTGRNFYSVDPKAIPSRNSFDVGRALADSLIARHREDTSRYPASVGLTVWGTSAMRT
ncbi:MAG: cobaltochelatase subunit CobN, partial [Sciscionella sp.]